MFRLYFSLCILMFILAVTSCKTDNTTDSKSVVETETYKAAKALLEKQPGQKSAGEVITELRKILATSNDHSANKVYLLEGLEIAEKFKLGSAAISFLEPLVKNYPNDPEAEGYLAKLASVLSDVGQHTPADILISSYESKYPNGKYMDNLRNKRKDPITEMDTLLKKLSEAVFINPDKFGINKANAQKYVDACEAFALGFRDDEDAPLYLYRAAEMARTLKTYNKSMSLYDWLEDRYPDYEKTPSSVFLKGFMLDNEIRDKEKAREVYQRFLSKYPNHELKGDVKFLLDNIDKTDEEIMEIIESTKIKK